MNARLTRKRRRIYDDFLKYLIADLTLLLASDIGMYKYDDISGAWNICKVGPGKSIKDREFSN